MLRIEPFEYNGRQWNRIYSDDNRYVVSNDGFIYGHICEPAESTRTFTEGDIIPEPDPTPNELLDILLGGTP